MCKLNYKAVNIFDVLLFLRKRGSFLPYNVLVKGVVLNNFVLVVASKVSVTNFYALDISLSKILYAISVVNFAILNSALNQI